MSFVEQSLPTIINLLIPLGEALGAPLGAIAGDKADDGKAISYLGQQLDELGQAVTAAFENGMTQAEVHQVVMESRDVKEALKRLAAELKDQTPGNFDASAGEVTDGSVAQPSDPAVE